ncbi:M48 family metallopeptidase [Paenibacillus doosanensis]|uniref:M48 family metallopeptidase n=1 Tax=Paenibacillus doosanensis TaxID=1229154 RepID=UPI00217FF751|nr:M48 family metallopeptidase [Paenibacillus doosanensis]MCS7460659.1 M48 family metallopeptidase [Paenibacillus doosanensis]
MRRGWIWIAILIIYCGAMAYYFLHQPAGQIPAALRGGPADPATFMTPEQIENAHRLATIGYLSYFISTPVEWGILIVLMTLGCSSWFRSLAERLTGWSLLRMAVYLLLLQLALYVIELPLDYYLHELNRSYGLTNQSASSWLLDIAKGFGVNMIISIPLYWLLYTAIKRSPRRWWLWGWAVSVPLTLFFTFIQPVVLAPIFNDFKPLQDQQLKQQILQLAGQANIPADQVYQVDKSKQTNALNAYVTGIGSTTRIVLWDTTLKKLNADEILFIMAHEMGHYVKHHVLWGTLWGIVESFIGFWLVFRLFHWIHRRWGSAIRARGPLDYAGLPVLLLLVSVLSFAASPLDNAISRMNEHSADAYAVELRGDPDAGIRAFQKLASVSLSDVNPPALVQFFLGTHPTLIQRIDYFQHSKGASKPAG